MQTENPPLSVNKVVTKKIYFFVIKQMSHGGHTANSGPSARSDMDHKKTGLSESTASFVAANCSPFTNPDDLIADGARVPDPATTQRTCSTTLYTSIQIPVIPDVYNTNHTAPATTATSGKQFIIVNANPLGCALPVQWCYEDTYNGNYSGSAAPDNVYRGFGPAANATNGVMSAMDPVAWGQMYDVCNQGDLIAKLYTLGTQSARHRIVGCAVKVNLGTDTTLNRGQIECGQFEIGDTRNTIVAGRTGSGTNGWWYYADVSRESTWGQNGMYASRLLTCDYQNTKKSVWNARNQNRGIMRAEDGASVRWTDSNQLGNQTTINKCMFSPEISYYDNGWEGEAAEQEETAAAATNDVIIKNCYLGRASSALPAGVPKGQVNVKARAITTGTNAFQNEYLMADNSARYCLTNTATSAAEGTGTTTGEPELYIGLNTLIDSSDDFDRGLYIDVTGVSPNQLLNVEVQWIVEYIPKVYSMDQGRHPPIDMNFPAIQAMVNDPTSYPIVVKGNSFFSSLWHGIKAAADGVGKLLKGTSSVAALIPDPRAQAYAKFGGAGGELLTGGGLQGALSRVM
ncbi:hypothetical protein [Geminiviridae sp.]|nr:hypothetical protein [Geminiviridae sp.]